jgi:hypothetical protein
MVNGDDVLLDSNGGAIEEQNLAYALSSARLSVGPCRADSWYQQRDWFRDEAEDRAIALFQTGVEVDINSFVWAFEREHYWLRRKSDAVTIHIENAHFEVNGLGQGSSVAAE